jgi:hypothetical protein
MTSFDKYTDSLVQALKHNPKAQDVIAKKQEILDGIYRFHNLTPTSVLFVGFNPAILSCRAERIGVTEISELALAYLKEKNVAVEYIDINDLAAKQRQYEAVIALEEYFTFADSDTHQQEQIKLFCSVASDFVISTLRDYKNQDFKDREFSHPVAVRNASDSKIFNEFHDWDLKDRTKWVSKVFEIDNTTDTMTTYGKFNRRTMYFKQLAKFSMDAGASDFLVHKNLMYKSLIKKNYEHVISIRFEQNGY